MTYVSEVDTAARYARYRPYVHPLIVDHISAVTDHVRCALDVGCGTGQSARALLRIANEVAGVDISAAMLSHAPHDARLSFSVAHAESLPFDADCFDLLTTGLAFHWFDQPAFLSEARRVLKPGGWLAIYNDGFTGIMADHPAYLDWHESQYFARFPNPPRNLKAGGEGQWASAGFGSRVWEKFDHDVVLTLDEWAGYLATQSNVIARIETGEETVETVAAWLKENGAPFFKDAPRSFRFYCVLDIYQVE